MSRTAVAAPTVPVTIETHGVTLHGDLSVPPNARGLIVFAHGSGGSRHSSRNRAVADVLQRGRFAALLMDRLVRDIPRLIRLRARFSLVR